MHSRFVLATGIKRLEVLTVKQAKIMKTSQTIKGIIRLYCDLLWSPWCVGLFDFDETCSNCARVHNSPICFSSDACGIGPDAAVRRERRQQRSKYQRVMVMNVYLSSMKQSPFHEVVYVRTMHHRCGHRCAHPWPICYPESMCYAPIRC